MFKSTQAFDSAIREKLTALCDGTDLNSLLPDDDSREAIAESIHRGYLQGIECMRTADGTAHFSVIKPMVTYRGLAFLESAK